ncbi:U11/U12 small nuclear ribonucleoprotein 25 kDa protein [Anticarsia gemmatalis]|uniref:U11/U12 small nuclear ribonucleoprotein 25 kDa protein n=1 Tax=Anticarsia gemmatalis TaxID=129554 RepID=UPI003F76CB44
MDTLEVVKEVTEDLSHDDLLEATEAAVGAILKNDSLLKDLHDDIIIEEISSQIAVEHGQSITIFVNRDALESLKVIIPQDATVRGLKKAIARHFELYQKRAGINVNISWKYIWRTYSLNYDSTVLDNDEACIQDYGVTNKVTLTFKKKKRKTQIT